MEPNSPRILKHDSKTHIVRRGTGTIEPQIVLKLCIGNTAAKPIVINMGSHAILGRTEHNSSEVDINLAAYDAAQKGVSRRHASLGVINTGVIVCDLKSTNGTFLNGQRLLPGQRRVIKDGDQLMLGKLLLYVFYAKTARQV